jgi:hypothetical protein
VDAAAYAEETGVAERVGAPTPESLAGDHLDPEILTSFLTVPFADVEAACLMGKELAIFRYPTSVQHELWWILIGAGTNGEYSGGEHNVFPWTQMLASFEIDIVACVPDVFPKCIPKQSS